MQNTHFHPLSEAYIEMAAQSTRFQGRKVFYPRLLPGRCMPIIYISH